MKITGTVMDMITVTDTDTGMGMNVRMGAGIEGRALERGRLVGRRLTASVGPTRMGGAGRVGKD